MRVIELVVVGDSLLDIDLVGQVDRVCPDAPAPVVDEVTEHPRPGGAAFAAALAASDGCRVTLVTPLADDEPAARLRELLAGAVRIVALPYDGATPVKRRIRVDGQSLARLDTGGPPGHVDQPSGAVAGTVNQALHAAQAILVSDYGRSASGATCLRRLLAALPGRIPVVWDPHPRGAAPLPQVRLVTPNAAEAAVFAERHGVPIAGGAGGSRSGRDGLAALNSRASGLTEAWHVGAVAVTMGARGALLSYGRGAPAVLPAPPVTAMDTCGAGDRFAVTAATSLAAGAVTAEAVQHAVHHATRFVADGGAAAAATRSPADSSVAAGSQFKAGTPPPQLEQLLARVRAQHGVVVATGGCFDLLHAGHVASLQAARRLGDCLVVCLNSDVSASRLKGPGRPLSPAADRERVLRALGCVDAVMVFDEDTPVRVLERLRPDIWAKGGDYAGAELPEASALRAWGGQAVVLPYVPGRSTTGLVRSAQLAGVNR